jgi:hypothetical protein
MSPATAMPAVWWGQSELPENTPSFWQIGPLAFWLQRTACEWRFASEHRDQAAEGTLVRERPATQPMPAVGPSLRRLGFRRTSGALRLLPALPDRPVVIQPSVPFSLPPAEETTLYVSTPLWLRVAVGEPLVEFVALPTHRPSDTWFGPDTRVGELCYALNTSARLQREDLPVRPYRVLTELRLQNLAASLLAVEKVKLPLPSMALFASAAGELWTDSVTLVRRQDGEVAALELSRQAPAHLRQPQRLAEPRVPPERGLLMRAFGGLIGGGRQP